jgi:hypothetical protein
VEFTLKSVNIYSLSSTDTGSLYIIIVLTDKIRFELLSLLKQSLLTLLKMFKMTALNDRLSCYLMDFSKKKLGTLWNVTRSNQICWPL